MKRILSCLVFVTAALAGFAQTPSPAPALKQPHLADYDAELRLGDGRVDTDAMVQRLKELGVTTYYWLVWHARTDWDDLELFLPKAAQARIDVWVYLVPPSEGPKNGDPASEPFQMDFLKWAEEIGRLSVQHTNLTGWVIDDFYANHEFFTPDYVRQMQTRSRQHNPRLAFLPLMYFNELTSQFARDYHAVIDGVVVAYPKDREEIAYARAVLRGENLTLPGQLSCAASTPTKVGDFVRASIPVRVLSAGSARLRFREQDDFTGPTAGYHFKQFRVDDVVVWEQDVAGGSNDWAEIKLDLPSQASGKANVVISFELFDKKGVSNFGLRWRVKDLRAEGLELAADLQHSDRWRVEKQGPFDAGFGPPPPPSQQRFNIPYLVMTAASDSEFRLRHGDPASPERIADWLRMCLECLADHQCDGVVTYCLDKQPQSSVFPLAQRLFKFYSR